MLTKINKAVRNRRGFTLIEMVVVVAILAILATIAYPKVTDYINQSRQSKVLSDLAAINTAAELAKVAGSATIDQTSITAQLASGWPTPPKASVAFGTTITVDGTNSANTAYAYTSTIGATWGGNTMAALKSAAGI